MGLGPNVIGRTTFGDNAGILPPAAVKDLFSEVGKDSLVLKLAGTMPMNINGATTTMQVGRPVAGVVGEGERKPVIRGGIKTKKVKPIKIAALTVNTTEARLANPGSYFDDVMKMMSEAMARAIDLAILHGKNGLSNTVIADVEYLDQSKNLVRLGTAGKADGGLRKDLVTGFGQVSSRRGRFTGFVADQRLITNLAEATDTLGQPLFSVGSDLKDQSGTILGLPTQYDQEAVAGDMGACPDTLIRAYGGDFAGNIKLGFVETVTWKRTDQATIVDGDTTIHTWQDNQEAYLVEAIVGWAIRDVDHFAKYEIAPPEFVVGGNYPAGSKVTYAKKEYVAVKDATNATSNPGADTTNWKEAK